MPKESIAVTFYDWQSLLVMAAPFFVGPKGEAHKELLEQLRACLTQSQELELRQRQLAAQAALVYPARRVGYSELSWEIPGRSPHHPRLDFRSASRRS